MVKVLIEVLASDLHDMSLGIIKISEILFTIISTKLKL